MEIADILFPIQTNARVLEKVPVKKKRSLKTFSVRLQIRWQKTQKHLKIAADSSTVYALTFGYPDEKLFQFLCVIQENNIFWSLFFTNLNLRLKFTPIIIKFQRSGEF